MNRIYRGPIKAVILDWSGTTVDKYVVAPARVFVDVFSKHGVPITMREARRPMGLRKDLHIARLLQMPDIKVRWIKRYGKEPSPLDVENMFRDFVGIQMGCLAEYAELLPETAETVDLLRKQFGVKIGSTTGFTKQMVDVLLRESEKQGYSPDVSVAGDEVTSGARPGPFMIYRNLDLLGIYPITSVVKVDDTIGGIGEGLNAGCWTVGISRWSNYMDFDRPNDDKIVGNYEIRRRVIRTRGILNDAGAHFVIETLGQLPTVINMINSLLKYGYTPYN